MLYKRIWEDERFRRNGKDYKDYKLVLSAANGNSDEVETLLKELRDAPEYLEMPNESNTTSSGTGASSEEGPGASTTGGKMIGSVKSGKVNESEFKTAYAALHAACAYGHEKIVKQLLDGDLCNVDADGTDRINGWTVLQVAALGGHKEIVQLLLDKGADINAPGAAEGGATALQAAARGGHLAVVKQLLDKSANINREENIPDVQGRTALQAAAEGGHAAVVKMLLDHGAAIRDPEPVAEWYGRTTFQAAAGAGHTEIMELLLRLWDPTDTENVRNIKGDILNAPGEGIYGRTALQAAAEGGHLAMVELLLEKGADINQAASERNGRTALQAAAGAGSKEMVELLLGKRANVNDACAGDGGRSALQAAAEEGHEGIVELLLEKKAKNGVGELISTWNGRTALQAAAETGREKVVEMLLYSGAEVDAPAAEYLGTMALEAAARRGHEGIVKLLIDHGAYVNARGANDSSVGAVRAAAKGGHVGLVGALIDAGANINDPGGQDGRNMIHEAAQGSYGLEVLSALVLRTPNCNTVDTSGSTPLHLAVRNGKLEAVKTLLEKAADLDKEIQDNSSNTPLQRALQEIPAGGQLKYPTEIVKVLLRKGASTDRIQTSEFRKVMDMPEASEYEKESNDCIIVSDDPKDGRTIKAASWSDHPVPGSWSPTDLFTCKERVMVFQKPSSSVQAADPSPPESLLSVPGSSQPRIGLPSRTDSKDAVNHIYLAPTGFYKDRERDSTSQSAVQWLRLSWTNSERADPINFVPGVPDNQRMLQLHSSSVMLVGYVCFRWPSGNRLGTFPTTTPNPLKRKSEEQVASFDPGAQEVQISWIMRKENGGSEEEPKKYMKFIRYRASFPLKTFALPTHGIEFVTWFLREVNGRWEELIYNARSHHAKRRMYQLSKAGKNRNIIHSLLEDSHEWTRLHGIWQEHFRKARDLVDKFKDYEALKGEFTENDSGRLAADALKNDLEKELKVLEEDHGKALSQLDNDTKELIQLEFNLVSIHEARRSLEMARSMKRLSWITFIFLPLMFIAGLFGMNVDVLSDNPPWQWYLVISGPFSVLVIITSILCRYLSIKELVKKKNIDKILPSTSLGDISGPPDAGNAQYDTQDTREQGPGNEMDKITPFCMRWRRKTAKPENDPESIPHSD